MRFRNFTDTVVALVLVSTPVAGQINPSFTPIGAMTSPRWFHSATLLADGRVLIAGGSGESERALQSSELYDPATGTFVPTGNMTVARWLHSATLLPDGKVLIAGGWGLSSAELYDPATGTFTATGHLLEDQATHTGTLLRNGTVLITGGQRARPPWPTAARPEIYDVGTGEFFFAGDYAGVGTLYPGSGGPTASTANLLPDGRVLIIGENPPEIYDPITDAFSLTRPLASKGYRFGMYWHNATTLRDGSVLITGGNDDWSCRGLPDAEIYHPRSGTFTVVEMTTPRDGHTSTLLRDGNVLLTGGGSGGCHTSTLQDAELFEVATGRFVAAGMMTRSRAFHTATLLNDGSVLITGGISYWPYQPIQRAELYRPPTTAKRRGVARR